MNPLKSLYERLPEGLRNHPWLQSCALRFVFIGGVNTLHFWLWYTLFLAWTLPYALAFTLGFLLSMVGSFFLNTYFTFKTRLTWKKFLQFPVTTLPNFIISQGGLWLLVEKLHVPKGISGLFASLIAIPITYAVTRLVLTKDDTPKDPNNPEAAGPKNEAPSGRALYRQRLRQKRAKSLSLRHQQEARAAQKTPWLCASDLWILLALIVFAVILHGYIFRSGFLYGDDHTDSTMQMIYFLPYLIKEVLLKGHLWSWTYGMGGDIFSEFSYYYTTSPILWSLLPIFKILPEGWYTLENSLNLKLFISIYKQVLIMAAMYGLLRYEKRSKGSSLAAAFVYGGCIHYLWNANYFDFFTDAFLWVPLMVLGLRIWQKKRNFWPLVISAALCCVNNYYFAYQTFLFFILFVLIMTVSRPKASGRRAHLIAYAQEVGSVAWQGVAALGVSMVAFLPQVLAFLRIDRFDTVNPVTRFFVADFYKNLPINLFFNNSSLGVPILILLAFFLNYRRTQSLTRRKMVLMLVSFVLYLFPFTGYFLNGMNYHSERWFYLLVFVFAYALADLLDEGKKRNYLHPAFVLILLAGSLILLILRFDAFQSLPSKGLYTAVFVFNLLAFLLLSLRQRRVASRRVKKALDGVVVALVAGIMIANGFAYAKDQTLNMNTTQMAQERMKTPEMWDVFSRTVPGPNEFYRTAFRSNNFENAPTLFGYYGMSTFASMTDGTQHDWIKRILNIRHDIVYLSSFKNLDDRLLLQGLFGVRYLVVDNESYQPLPYFKKIYQNSVYSLYENPYFSGLDLWYDAELPVASLYRMIQPDMDLNLLHYAVTEKNNNLPKGAAKRSEALPLSKDVMSFERVFFDGKRIEFLSEGTVDFTIPKPYERSQIYLHAYLRPEDRMEFSQTVNGKSTFKSYEHNPYIYYTNDWTFAVNGADSKIRWNAQEKTYELRDLYLHRVDLRSFPELMAARNRFNLEDLNLQGNHITGRIKNDTRGALVLNIPYNKGWRVTDRGKPLEIQRMNGFLSGIVLEPGDHELHFHFRSQGLLPGLWITLFTLLSLAAFDVFRRSSGRLAKGPVACFAPILPDEDCYDPFPPPQSKKRSAHPKKTPVDPTGSTPEDALPKEEPPAPEDFTRD
ncbi:hypothetical protein ABB02_01148 [Clostridiaceae bacterium JG1575]|nr:hypothetical protein ABB02_01148 [Clostridiaceae bacterium JG1575]